MKNKKGLKKIIIGIGIAVVIIIGLILLIVRRKINITTKTS